MAPLVAQPLIPPPSGVYCSCGPTLGVGHGSVDPAVAAKPFVRGILVRVPWELLEPSPGDYRWQLIDGQIAAARSFGKRIALGIGCGPAIPQWVFDAGATRLVSQVPRHDTIAVPWDDVYLDRWTATIRAAGARYRDDSTIALVYITHSTGNGFEMQLPFVSTPSLAGVGYTDARMTDSWLRVAAAFAAAFPRHILTNDVHPVNGGDAVADAVVAGARALFGDRYGASAWWWTQHNTAVYPAQYALLRASAATDPFAGVQMAYSGTTDSSAFGIGGMPEALRLAIADGICYWEIWNADILNPAFETLLSTASCNGPTSVDLAPPVEPHLNAWPNPCRTTLHVAAPDARTGILFVYDVLGRSVKILTLDAGSTLALDVQSLPSGLYHLLLCNGSDRPRSRGFRIVH